MKGSNDGDTRRNVLKKLSAAGIAVGGIGTVRGSSDDEKDGSSEISDSIKEDDEDDAGNVMKLTKSNMLPKEKWDDVEPRTVSPEDREVSPDAIGSSQGEENTEVHGKWKDEGSYTPYCVSGSDGKIYYENLCTLYKPIDSSGNIVKDSDGNYKFIAELWGYSEVKSNFGLLCPVLEIEKHEHKLHSEKDSTSFEGRDPKTKSRINDERLTVEKYSKIKGIKFGKEEIVRVNDGTFGPYSWTPGESGNYFVEWEGETSDWVNVLAYVELSSDSDDQFNNNEDTGLRWGWSISDSS